MKTLFNDFLSNKALFFNHFDNAAKNIVEMAYMLHLMVNATDACERETITKQIGKKENIGDDITHKIYLALHKVLFSPLSRNDIHALASAIDDVADTIKEASGRMHLYNIDEYDPAIKEIAAIILKASLEIEKAVVLLRSSKKAGELPMVCSTVKAYERQSCNVYFQAVAQLFEVEKNPIRLLKYREILFALETSVNKCKKVTDILNVILING
jgi:predicted phosphate transport protein (TIGR00153 family)